MTLKNMIVMKKMVMKKRVMMKMVMMTTMVMMKMVNLTGAQMKIVCFQKKRITVVVRVASQINARRYFTRH